MIFCCFIISLSVLVLGLRTRFVWPYLSESASRPNFHVWATPINQSHKRYSINTFCRNYEAGKNQQTNSQTDRQTDRQTDKKILVTVNHLEQTPCESMNYEELNSLGHLFCLNCSQTRWTIETYVRVNGSVGSVVMSRVAFGTGGSCYGRFQRRPSTGGDASDARFVSRGGIT